MSMTDGRDANVQFAAMEVEPSGRLASAKVVGQTMMNLDRR
jgi:hypothetical protein